MRKGERKSEDDRTWNSQCWFPKGKESKVDDTGTGIDVDRVFLRAMRGDVVLYLITFSIMQVWCGVYVSSERTRKGKEGKGVEEKRMVDNQVDNLIMTRWVDCLGRWTTSTFLRASDV